MIMVCLCDFNRPVQWSDRRYRGWLCSWRLPHHHLYRPLLLGRLLLLLWRNAPLGFRFFYWPPENSHCPTSTTASTNAAAYGYATSSSTTSNATSDGPQLRHGRSSSAKRSGKIEINASKSHDHIMRPTVCDFSRLASSRSITKHL